MLGRYGEQDGFDRFGQNARSVSVACVDVGVAQEHPCWKSTAIPGVPDNGRDPGGRPPKLIRGPGTRGFRYSADPAPQSTERYLGRGTPKSPLKESDVPQSTPFGHLSALEMTANWPPEGSWGCVNAQCGLPTLR